MIVKLPPQIKSHKYIILPLFQTNSISSFGITLIPNFNFLFLGKKRTEQQQPQQQNYSIDDLLDKADEFVETMKPELADRFYIKALEMDKNNTRALESYAQFLLEMDDFQKAKQVLFIFNIK